jgi:putative addiction module killer protein
MTPAVETEAFRAWLKGLRDRQAVARINTRIIRLRLGNPGDVSSVGDGVSELRLMFGPGYRVYYSVYYAMQAGELIILLAGGDKSTQERDIRMARELWRNWKEQHDG